MITTKQRYRHELEEVIANAKEASSRESLTAGNELCEAWACRVLQAKKHYDDGDRTSASSPLKTRTPTRFEP